MSEQRSLAPLSEKAKSLKKGIYKHYKGHICEVIAIARHSETLEEYVVYKKISDNEFWIRPVEMFYETVTINEQVVPRFQKQN